jgi:U2 small nuclear ribonucleoprotein A'
MRSCADEDALSLSLSLAGELDNLESFKKLKMLSLLGNPVTQKPNYRLHLIAKLPGLKVIDFRKVKPRVRPHLTSPRSNDVLRLTRLFLN